MFLNILIISLYEHQFSIYTQQNIGNKTTLHISKTYHQITLDEVNCWFCTNKEKKEKYDHIKKIYLSLFGDTIITLQEYRNHR